MNLYHFTVVTDTAELTVVVAAQEDEQAFKQAEIEVEKSFLKLPIINEIVLIERKKLGKSAAFVIQ